MLQEELSVKVVLKSSLCRKISQVTVSSVVCMFSLALFPCCPHRLCGRGRGVPRQPDGGRKCHLFWAGNRAVFLGNRRFSWQKLHDHRRFWKGGFFKRLFESTEVLYLTKKTSNIYKWKEKVQKNTGRRRKVQVTIAAFKGLHRFVFFTPESLPCSETQPSKWSF